MLKMVSERLKKEVEQKKEFLISRYGEAGYALRRNNKERAFLQNLAHVYSWWLEHPDLRRLLLEVERKDKKNVRRIARIGARQVGEAWEYLKSETKRNVVDSLTPKLIKDLGNIVDRNNTGYRRGTVSLGLGKYVPPNPLRVSYYIEGTIEYLKTRRGLHLLEAATYLHLRIVGIQPFNDGNKRVARLLQNKVLLDGELPIVLISPGEREIYTDLLEDGLADFRDEKIEGVRKFGNFIASKVNIALDDMIGDLRPRGYVYKI